MRFPALAIVALVVVPVSLTGCGKKEQPQQAPAGPATTTITVNGGTVAVREEEGVQRYSDEGPESGTVYLVHDAILRKGADQSSDIISRLGRGTGVNKKARRGAYYLVDFPSAGAMKPGWLPQSDVNSQPAVVTTTTPTVTTIPVRKARP